MESVVKVRVVRRVFSQNLVDERGVPPGPLEQYRKFPILSRSLVMTNATELEIFNTVPVVLVVLPVHPLSFVRKHGAPLLLLSSGPDGSPRSSTKFCEKTRRTTLTLSYS
eukprot:sb/3477270/